MLIVTAAPDTLPVTRAQALAQLRILSEGDLDTGQIALIDDLIEEAVEKVEIESGTTLAIKGLEQSFCAWSRRLALAAFPVRGVDAVVYTDADGVEQTVDEDLWTWERTDTGADVVFRSTWSAPALDPILKYPIAVRFTAGFNDPNGTEGDAALNLPRPARNAIRLLIESWFRSPSSQGVMVDAALDLVTLFKIYR